jgi:hypothetical protein
VRHVEHVTVAPLQKTREQHRHGHAAFNVKREDAAAQPTRAPFSSSIA